MASGCQLKISGGSDFKVQRFRVIQFLIFARPEATTLIIYLQIRISHGNECASTVTTNPVWARDCGFWIYGIASLCRLWGFITLMKLHLITLPLRPEDTKKGFCYALGAFVAKRITSKFLFRSDWPFAASGAAFLQQGVEVNMTN